MAEDALTPDASCPLCGEPVRWVMSVLGHRIALDPQPHEAGIYVPRDGGRRFEGLTGERLPAQETAYRSHKKSCPGSREAARLRALAKPKCRGCPYPLDPVLAARGDIYHPTCGPTDVREHAARARDLAAATRLTDTDDTGQEALPL